VAVTVTEDGEGHLTATVEYRDGEIVFVNTYTPTDPPTDPPPTTDPPSGNAVMRISKLLTDADGNEVGAGKRFAVRLYDAAMNELGRYILSANSDAFEIPLTLTDGETYYIAEEPGEVPGEGFIILGYEIVGVGETEYAAVGVRVELQNGADIHIIVKNEAVDLDKIPDFDPPGGAYDPPDDIPVFPPDKEKPAETITVCGKKIWQHGKNPIDKQPASVVIYVLANGEPYASFALDEESHWRFKLELPMHDSGGREIQYTVDEAAVADYTKSIDGFNITNTHKSFNPGADPGDSPKTADAGSLIYLWILLGAALTGIIAAMSRRRGGSAG